MLKCSRPEGLPTPGDRTLSPSARLPAPQPLTRKCRSGCGNGCSPRNRKGRAAACHRRARSLRRPRRTPGGRAGPPAALGRARLRGDRGTKGSYTSNGQVPTGHKKQFLPQSPLSGDIHDVILLTLYKRILVYYFIFECRNEQEQRMNQESWAPEVQNEEKREGGGE